MNKIAKMAALLMTAVMFAFTSCGDSDDDKKENAVASAPVAKVALITLPEVLDCVEGTVKVEFKPSGKSQTMNLSAATGTKDDEMLSVAKITGENLSKYETQGRTVVCEVKGDINDTECVITPNLKAKYDLDFSADKYYDFHLLIPYKITLGTGGIIANAMSFSNGGIVGDKFQGYVGLNNISETIKLK